MGLGLGFGLGFRRGRGRGRGVRKAWVGTASAPSMISTPHSVHRRTSCTYATASACGAKVRGTCARHVLLRASAVCTTRTRHVRTSNSVCTARPRHSMATCQHGRHASLEKCEKRKCPAVPCAPCVASFVAPTTTTSLTPIAAAERSSSPKFFFFDTLCSTRSEIGRAQASWPSRSASSLVSTG